jgi:hypothetical protein
MLCVSPQTKMAQAERPAPLLLPLCQNILSEHQTAADKLDIASHIPIE